MEAAFSQRQISRRGRKVFNRRDQNPWLGLRDSDASARRKIQTLCNCACTKFGFCGGPGYAPDLIDGMQSLNAADFAWALLEAEGMADTFEFDTTWRPVFEAMFMDVFGDGAIALDG